MVKEIIDAVFAYNGNSSGSITITGSTANVVALGTGELKADYKFAVASGISGEYYGVVVPKNTAYVRFSYTNNSNIKNDAYCAKVIWGKNEEGGLSNTIKYVSEETSYNAKTETSKAYAIPSGVDVIAYKTTFATPSTYTAKELMETAGFKMEFLTSLS